MNAEVTDKEWLQREIDINYEAFLKKLDQYVVMNNEKFAPMHQGQVEHFFDTWQDAYNAGNMTHKDVLFSFHKVTRHPVDLGYFSHV